jgi:phage protein D
LHIDTTGQTGLPEEGAVLTWQEGYGDNLIDKGQFKITRIVPKLFPPSVTIVGTAPYKKLRQSYDTPTTAQQAYQDDLIKSQRQGTSVTLDALVD